MWYRRALGLAFCLLVTVFLLSGSKSEDDEAFEAVRVAERMVSDDLSRLGFEERSVLRVSMTDLTMSPVEKNVSLIDAIQGKVRYTSRASVTPTLEGTTHVVRANAFVFDVESERPDQIRAIAEEKAASLQGAITNTLKVKGWYAS
jgi:hypothetical protein